VSVSPPYKRRKGEGHEPEATLAILDDVPDERGRGGDEAGLGLVAAVELVGVRQASVGAVVGEPAVHLVVSAVNVQGPLNRHSALARCVVKERETRRTRWELWSA
jgi:hypothetical protein